MSELSPRPQNPNTNAHLQMDPTAQTEFGQPLDLIGERSASLTPDTLANLAPETDPLTAAIDVQEGPIAATGLDVAVETTGRHHRSDDHETTIDPTIQTELTRLQSAKQNMIKIFGQDTYQERFANNPNVDPDAYVGKLQNEATPGRHAAVEVAQPDSEAATDFVAEAAVAEEAGEVARKVVKRSLSDLAKESTKLRWSEEEQARPKQAQTQKVSPLTRAAKMGELRVGWANDEPDARNVFLNRQRRRARPFTVSKQVDPRMRTQKEIDALTMPLNATKIQSTASTSETPSIPEAQEDQAAVPIVETAINQSNESMTPSVPVVENGVDGAAPVFERQFDLLTHGQVSAEDLRGADSGRMPDGTEAEQYSEREDTEAQRSWDTFMAMLENSTGQAPEVVESNVVDLAHRRGFGRAALKALLSRQRGDRAA